jgi:GalNAc-alpha-(1->4)-GalNAc-alpha-(1->3)-diNAcBac-PP-undecaprenol alpha-1,4-N-acetyl-D-galactosaminyltransferase
LENNKISIGFAISSMRNGGAERVMSILVNYFSEKYDVHLFIYSEVQSFYPLDNNVKIHYLFNENITSKYDLIKKHFKAFFLFQKICKTYEIKCLISFTTFVNAISIILGKKIKIPILISERFEPLYCNPGKLNSFFRKLTYRFASDIILQTAQVEKSFTKLGVKLPLRKSVIFNPIDNNFKRNTQIIKEKVILSIGRLSDEKGHHLLLQSFAVLKLKDWKLEIIGDGVNKEKLINLASKLGISESVIFLGKKKDVIHYLNRCSIFVLPSLTEGFPNVLCEAMATGCAVVSFDCPNGPSELIQNYNNGILVENGSIEELSNAIIYLVNNEDIRVEFGLKASEIHNILDKSLICREWEEIIKKRLV